MNTLDSDEWDKRYEASLQRERDATPNEPAVVRHFIVCALGGAVLLGCLGLFIGPIGGWHSPSLRQRLGNAAVFALSGATLGYRIFTTRSRD